MTKTCPECGNEVPDDAHFCADCGHDFFDKASSRSRSSDSIFSNGKIFLALIAIVVIVGAVVILSSGFGQDQGPAEVKDVVEHAVDLTITDVSGWDSDSSAKKSYTLYTEAIFNEVPSDLKGYNIKATYFDENGTEIGHEIETLDNVYYDSDYSISFGFYNTYKKPNPDHVTVEIIKGGKTVDNYTSKVDQSKIDYLN
jgi:predicted nucleic acid-binding Zn ribbon protein